MQYLSVLSKSIFMNKNSAWIIVAVLIAVPFAYAIHLYPYLPASIPTHFGANGEPDQYGGRNSIYLVPGILGGASLLTFLLLANLRKIDPKRYEKTDDGLFFKFALFMVFFLSCLSLGILYITSHPGISAGKFLVPALGILFAGIGAFMPRFKQNYFAGLRLPWTLDNEDNWNATHKMAGNLWIIGGFAIALGGLLFESSISIYVFLAIMVIMIAIPVVFSYRMFKNGNQPPDSSG
jgi:uncharacterized membrane protein